MIAPKNCSRHHQQQRVGSNPARRCRWLAMPATPSATAEPSPRRACLVPYGADVCCARRRPQAQPARHSRYNQRRSARWRSAPLYRAEASLGYLSPRRHSTRTNDFQCWPLVTRRVYQCAWRTRCASWLSPTDVRMYVRTGFPAAEARQKRRLLIRISEPSSSGQHPESALTMRIDGKPPVRPDVFVLAARTANRTAPRCSPSPTKYGLGSSQSGGTMAPDGPPSGVKKYTVR